MALARKQTLASQEKWNAARAASRELWPDNRLDNLVDKTVAEIRLTTKGKHVGIAWSGGKDSIALHWVMDQVGHFESALGISELEFPAFLQWVTEHMPPGLRVVNCGLSLDWLASNPRMLFPQGDDGPRWFRLVNHKAQRQFFQRAKLDMLVLGRRHSDGNYTGPRGTTIYTNREGVTRYSPLADWPHEAVFSLIEREKLPMPPCYGWPRGFQVGTGSWPARQWTKSVDHGFDEVWSIDPDVIRGAEDRLPQAADWLARTGRS